MDDDEEVDFDEITEEELQARVQRKLDRQLDDVFLRTELFF